MSKPFLWGAALTVAFLAFAGCAKDSEIVVDLGSDSGTPSSGLVGSGDGGDAGAGDGGTDAPLLMCMGTECPAPWATCPSFDGVITQKCSTNLSTDNLNCGTCGHACNGVEELGLLMRCVAGACQRECSSDTLRDCNGFVEDGCEVDLDHDDENCGACGNACAPGVRCHDGKCGCPAGQIDCEFDGCVDPTSDDWNCGACGVQCTVDPDAPEPFPNTAYGCVNSECGKLHCTNGFREAWRDCNGDIHDGCEINTAADPNNCGTCGTKCAPGQICLSDGVRPPKCACDPGQTLCGATTEYPWCADLQNDKQNCGTCGHQCPGGLAQGAPTCEKGFCDYVCDQGWGDCDGDRSNGCETNLLTSGAHCGACGVRCDTSEGQPCIDGKCLMIECDGGPVQ